jgi:hypothetical protein
VMVSWSSCWCSLPVVLALSDSEEYSEGNLDVLLVRGPNGIASLVTRRSTGRMTPRYSAWVGPHPRMLCRVDGGLGMELFLVRGLEGP